MQFRLRTLLIVFAAAPALLSVLLVLYMGRVDCSQQIKVRETRKRMHAVWTEMAQWLLQPAQYDPKSEVVEGVLHAKLVANCGVAQGSSRDPADAWGRA